MRARASNSFLMLTAFCSLFFPVPVHAANLPEASVQCMAGKAESTSKAPLYITPHIEHLELADPKQREELVALLDGLEPDGPAGDVQLGYTIGILPYGYFEKKGDKWELNLASLEQSLSVAGEIGRPVHIYVLGNHFTPLDTPLTAELLTDERNLMRYADGTVPDERYFGSRLAAFRLTTDTGIPATDYKLKALHAVAAYLKKFDEEHPGLIVAVTLNGETHYVFEDFHNGTGNFASPRLTDFSDGEIAEFQAYLDTLMQRMNAAEIRKVDFTRNPTGYIPFSGWYDGPGAVSVYLDGGKIGEARMGVNRLDVMEAKGSGVKTPNSGFSYEVDAAVLTPGTHWLQAIIEQDGKRYELGQRWITVENSARKLSFQFRTPKPVAAESAGKRFRGWLDHPANELPVLYKPIARLWKHFRERQVLRYVNALGEVFRQEGFDTSRVFSYQIAPWLFGSWNPLLFGVGDDFFRKLTVLPGVSLYGGNVSNINVFADIDPARGYGVPEMHPQIPGGDDFIRRGLAFHRCNGAAFMAPYYFRLAKELDWDRYGKMSIAPNNPAWGSDAYYRALADFVKN